MRLALSSSGPHGARTGRAEAALHTDSLLHLSSPTQASSIFAKCYVTCSLAMQLVALQKYAD